MLLSFCKTKFSNTGPRGFAMIHIDVATCGSWVLSFIFLKTSFSLFHFNHAWFFTNISVITKIISYNIRYYTLINESGQNILVPRYFDNSHLLEYSQKGEKRGNIFLHVIMFFIANLKYCLHPRNSPALVYSILVIWTWSMLQFPLDLAGKYLMFVQRNRK